MISLLFALLGHHAAPVLARLALISVPAIVAVDCLLATFPIRSPVWLHDVNVGERWRYPAAPDPLAPVAVFASKAGHWPWPP